MQKKVIVQKSVTPHEGAAESVAVSRGEFFEEAMKQNVKPQTKSSENKAVQIAFRK